MRGKILIVDDDRIGTDVRAAFLRLKGFSTEIAYSGSEALGNVSIKEFTAIVIGYDMPDMNGLQLAFHLRQRGYVARIIMLSGRIECPSKPGAELLTGFVSKGESPESLLDLLADISRRVAAKNCSLD
jgi:CheY-like chemotaxis protein